MTDKEIEERLTMLEIKVEDLESESYAAHFVLQLMMTWAKPNFPVSIIRDTISQMKNYDPDRGNPSDNLAELDGLVAQHFPQIVKLLEGIALALDKMQEQ